MRKKQFKKWNPQVEHLTVFSGVMFHFLHCHYMAEKAAKLAINRPETNRLPATLGVDDRSLLNKEYDAIKKYNTKIKK